ncbi:MAG: hypothetical protein M0C28_34265 [Candidatus Moduliflexus flocculans]|nr:hypothetical protein [Candidatus Moduliflexus flocculans]
MKKPGRVLSYSADEVFGRADLLLKVARPTKEEIELASPGTTVAGFLHLASTQRDKVDLLLEKKITAIAYEQIQAAGWFPAGAAPVQSDWREHDADHCGALPAMQPRRQGHLVGWRARRSPAEVVILGSGVVATYAAQSVPGAWRPRDRDRQ